MNIFGYSSWWKNNDYVMFIDENNLASSINNVKRKIANNVEISPNENIFTVSGCIFSYVEYQTSVVLFDKLRKKYWKDRKYFNIKKNDYEIVCFHSEDIRGRKKGFHRDVINDVDYNNFIVDLDNILNKLSYKIISINIDLKNYILNPYNNEMDVYKVAFNFIVERFIYNMKRSESGKIVFEARGKKEDKSLLEHIDKIINYSGTEYISTEILSNKISGIYFNKKRDTFGYPYTGLEIADLSSYPIHRYVKFNSIGKDFLTIKKKIVGYPNSISKGLKIFPKKIEAGFDSPSTDHECDP